MGNGLVLIALAAEWWSFPWCARSEVSGWHPGWKGVHLDIETVNGSTYRGGLLAKDGQEVAFEGLVVPDVEDDINGRVEDEQKVAESCQPLNA